MSLPETQPTTNWLNLAATRQLLPGLTLLDLMICIALMVSVASVYIQTAEFDFIGYDDDLYVTKNAHVLEGLSPANIAWAATAVTASNWIPVTLLSHMVDVEIFGSQSGMHHVTNVVIHGLACLLLFAVLLRATRARWPAAFVAFVFALHPLHVESVAWISERKDVLSAFFLFLTLYCYVRYVERPGTGRYLAVVATFCLGLMSKPMLVTLPFLLLLFDLWPMRRFQWPKVLWEKLPLFALSAMASMITYWVQRTNQAVNQRMALDARLIKALISYFTYLRQTFWPRGLAVFYPYPRFLQAWQGGVSLILILSVAALAIYARRTRPYLVTGWFWYLGTLVPVIGLVQVGEQSHADRYMYIPLVGLLMMVAWGAADIAGKWPRIRPAIAAAGLACCVACLALTAKQVTYWKNSETLYLRAIDVTQNNSLAHGNLGAYLMELPDRRVDAIEHLEAALRIEPDNAVANNNLGLCLSRVQLCGAAIPHFQAALRAKPNLSAASNNLGTCLAQGGDYAGAIPYFEDAVRLMPDQPDFQLNLARVFELVPGHTQEAIVHFKAVQRLRPDPEIARTLDRLRSGQK